MHTPVHPALPHNNGVSLGYIRVGCMGVYISRTTHVPNDFILQVGRSMEDHHCR